MRRQAWVVGVVVLGMGLTFLWQAGWLPMLRPNSLENSAESPPLPQPVTATISQPDAARPAPAQLKLVQWVFDHGGFVNVQTPASTKKPMGGTDDIYHVNELPAGPFTAWRVNFAPMPIPDEPALEELVACIREAGTVSNLNLRGLSLPANALGRLASIETLSNLDLKDSPAVTREAVPYLAACRHLTLLRIGGGNVPVDRSIVEELRAQLPGCEVNDSND